MVYLPHWPIPSTLGKRQIDYETVFERMSEVLEKLGNPHKNLPPVIHIAGTNGKGSATALIAQIFSCAGYKTHIYTSPHLHDCNERIVLSGEKISDNFLFEVMEEVRLAAAETPLTFMESFTIGAFLAFAKTPADVAIIECGMGGRIDATNIIEKKLATLIMPISFDHTEYLGNSIERIALEKAMIMRPNTPLIVSSQSAKALEIIDILAKDQHIETYYYDRDFAVMKHEENDEFDIEFFGKNKNFYLEIVNIFEKIFIQAENPNNLKSNKNLSLNIDLYNALKNSKEDYSKIFEELEIMYINMLIHLNTLKIYPKNLNEFSKEANKLHLEFGQLNLTNEKKKIEKIYLEYRSNIRDQIFVTNIFKIIKEKNIKESIFICGTSHMKPVKNLIISNSKSVLNTEFNLILINIC